MHAFFSGRARPSTIWREIESALANFSGRVLVLMSGQEGRQGRRSVWPGCPDGFRKALSASDGTGAGTG